MIFAKRALIEQSWESNVRVDLAMGKITKITVDGAPTPGDARVDTLLPALSNVHSHSFQRAMAGMTEYRRRDRDDFWTWRETMYRFLDQLTPDMVEAIAALVFVEMMEAGFSAVGEFHYLHHQPGGRPYDNLAEMSERIFAAAATTGIGLTHLPVLYTYGGAARQPLRGGQLRFGNDVDRFLRLMAATRRLAAEAAHDTVLGTAPHSLRASAPGELAALHLEAEDGPVHMHVAEQVKEVADVEAWLGARPVAWVLDHMPINDRWCLIHTTHMNEAETASLAASGAVAGLCPITEANLGDGIFNGASYLAAGGRLGIGSDSNVRIALGEELRQLEYAQRLKKRARNIMLVEEGSVGAFLYTQTARGGARALRREAGVIAEDRLADLVAIDSQHPSLCALSPSQLLDGLVFAAPASIITDVWAAGRHQVRDGRHVAREAVLQRWRRTAMALTNSL